MTNVDDNVADVEDVAEVVVEDVDCPAVLEMMVCQRLGFFFYTFILFQGDDEIAAEPAFVAEGSLPTLADSEEMVCVKSKK